MKRLSSKALRNLTTLLAATLPLLFLLIGQGCSDPLAVRDSLTRALDGDGAGARFTISADGAVFARGPVQKVANASFDLSNETFEVTPKTSMIDASGEELRVSDLRVGLVLEVDAIQQNDGTFEVSFAEVPFASSASADDGDEDIETPGDSVSVDDSASVKVIICHIPPGNPDNARTKSVGAAAVPAHLAHGDYEGECVEDSGQDPDSTGVGDPDSTEVGDPDSTDVGGDDSGLEDSEDGDDDEDDDSTSVKVTICHIPPGNPGNAKTKTIDEDDVQDHLDHGDYEGECVEDAGGQDPDSTQVGSEDDGNDPGDDGDEGEEVDDDDSGAKVTICHIPPGHPDRAKTKTIDEEDVQDHLEHGDTLGECGSPSDSGGG